MIDALVLLALGLATAWSASAVLGLCARTTIGLDALRLLFGSARGALVVPPAVGVVAMATVYASHRNVLLARDVRISLVGDGDGCLHWLAHATGVQPTLWAALLGCTLLPAALAPAIAWLRARTCDATIVRRIDRAATRRIRRVAASTSAEPRVYAAMHLEGVGPLARRLRGRAVVLVPNGLDVPDAELRAVVAHERAHVLRGHLSRRWCFESLLAFVIPRALAGRCLAAGRAEDEWEADDDAASAVGSRLAVARALVLAATNVASNGPAARGAAAFLIAESGLERRVGRLLQDAPRPLAGVRRALAAAIVAGAALAAAQIAVPMPGLWAFCRVEQLLGFSCA